IEGSGRLNVLLFFFIPVLILFGVGFVFGPLGTSFFGTKPPSFFQVPKPNVELPADPVLHIGHFSVTNTLIASWFTIIVLVVLAFTLTRKMKLIPGKRQAMAEAIVEGLLNFVESVAGKKHARTLFAGVATIFLYVISNAYLALFPFFCSITIKSSHGEFALFLAATPEVNFPLSIAIMSFIFVETWGMRALGVTHYLSEFINVRQMIEGLKQLLKGKIGQGVRAIVFGFINLFVGVLEIFSHLTRMLSFTFRLFGNMTAGEI